MTPIRTASLNFAAALRAAEAASAPAYNDVAEIRAAVEAAIQIEDDARFLKIDGREG